ncbi:MAG: ATP-grasp domain-containing protein, partial [Bacteroidia bacterium]
MNILILGSGGRECAFAWKISQSPLCTKLFIAPGNAGTAQYGKNIAMAPTDFEAVKKVCIEESIDILLPGNEDPLVAGVYDFFKQDEALKHIIVVGPSRDGAILEGSKAFSKDFMQRHNIPTAAYREFDKDSYEAGIAYIQNHNLPVVLKADGLAAGKGVIIAENTADALEAFKSMIQDAMFGTASAKVVVEEFLTGIELSVFAFTDGKNFLLLPEAKDYKRIGEGDTGLNTGGMGAVSPLPFADKT